MAEVILGIPGPWAADIHEASDHYTTKIGGLPDWAFPEGTLKPDSLKCKACGSQLCLVAQVYAPISSDTSKIDERVIYVFGCVMSGCGSSSISWRAFRVQRRSNKGELYANGSEVASSTASSNSVSKTDWWEDFDDGDDKDMDVEELKKAFSEAANLVSHSKKQSCGQPTGRKIKPSSLGSGTIADGFDMPVVPCFYICYKKEPSSMDAPSICANYSSLSIKGNESDGDDHVQKETWEEERYEYDRALNADRIYLKFKKRLDAYPEQCFRYSYGGKPLLADGEAVDPASCSLCGNARHFEMQLMPPLLYFLQEREDDHQKLSLNSWDWMTLLVYTCSKNCSDSPDLAEQFDNDDWIVAEEVVISQAESPQRGLRQLAYFS